MIEHLKSGLSISTHVGCTMSCSYCVLSSLNGFAMGPQQDTSPRDIVHDLMHENTLFLNGETPLIINNRTDPLLPAVEKSTYGLLDRLIDAGITSPVLLISKFPASKRLTAYFECLPLMYIYSYSNLPADFNYRLLERHLSQISEHVPEGSRFHYLRPIIPHQNDDPKQIVDCLSAFQAHHFSGSIMTGLRVTAQNRSLIDRQTEFDPQHKLLQQGLFLRVLDAMNSSGTAYPVYRHTSCAIASFLKRRCKLRYYNRTDHCTPHCENRAVCAQAPANDMVAITAGLVHKFGPGFQAQATENDTLTITSQVTQEQVAFIKNAYGIGVKAENMILSPSERSILGHE